MEEVTTEQLCTYTEGEDKGICDKDFGGPLAYKNDNGAHELIGIASYTDPDCSSGKAVFTRVSQYIRWITETTGEYVG